MHALLAPRFALSEFFHLSRRSFFLTILVMAALLASSAAHAQISSPTCRLTGNAFNLGAYDPDSPSDSTQQIGIQCDVNFAWNAAETSATFKICVYMGEDAGTKPGYNPWRYMTNNNFTGAGTGYMAYNIYADSARTQILSPQGTASTLVTNFTVPRSGASTYATNTGTITVHARIPSGQAGLSAGSYYSYNPPFTLAYSALAGSAAPSNCEESGSSSAGQIQITAQATDHCSVGTSVIDFGVIGDIGSIGTAKAADGSVVVKCNAGNVYTVYLGEGNYHVATGMRQMANDDDRLAYQLYQDSAHTLVWDDINGVNRTATGSDQTIAVHGLISSGTPIPATPGTYTDTVIVTVKY